MLQLSFFQMVMLAAGASFTAALTDKGTVVAWGNLRVGITADFSGII